MNDFKNLLMVVTADHHGPNEKSRSHETTVVAKVLTGDYYSVVFYESLFCAFISFISVLIVVERTEIERLNRPASPLLQVFIA